MIFFEIRLKIWGCCRFLPFLSSQKKNKKKHKYLEGCQVSFFFFGEEGGKSPGSSKAMVQNNVGKKQSWKW